MAKCKYLECTKQNYSVCFGMYERFCGTYETEKYYDTLSEARADLRKAKRLKSVVSAILYEHDYNGDGERGRLSARGNLCKSGVQLVKPAPRSALIYCPCSATGAAMSAKLK